MLAPRLFAMDIASRGDRAMSGPVADDQHRAIVVWGSLTDAFNVLGRSGSAAEDDGIV